MNKGRPVSNSQEVEGSRGGETEGRQVDCIGVT